MKRVIFAVGLAIVWLGVARAEVVRVGVDCSAKMGEWRGVWGWWGYDECNYTYMKDGKKLLGELARLSEGPVYLRCHNLLTSGDGAASLKWGSTNAYREDEQGRPVHDWTILDRIFDAYKEVGARPLVEVGFMPEALSAKPAPYRHDWPRTFSTGWAYPPRDYEKWAGLVHAWVRHCVERYGKEAVEGWLWELWNEPDIGYWRGTPEEYFKLYDYTADAVKRACPTAKVGGPHTTNPGDGRSGQYLRGFLEHCARGTNAATGKVGSPVDFIGFHAKGATRVVDGRGQMDMRPQLRAISKGFEIVASFPEWKGTPIVIGESDPEGSAASAARLHPQNSYRNGPQYAAYTAATLKHTLDLERERGVKLKGIVTWAFEFEGQPFFEGYRTLATNGVDKPVMNLFRMLGMMRGERLGVTSSGGRGTEAMMKEDVRRGSYVDGLATGREGEVSVLVWNYHDDTLPGDEAGVELTVGGMPSGVKRVMVKHYRVDDRRSNAYAVWLGMGSPAKPTEEQYKKLEAAGGLEMMEGPRWCDVVDGKVKWSLDLPRQGVSLVQVGW